MIQAIEGFLRRWRWNSVLSPIYALYMLVWGVFLIVQADEYEKIEAYKELFDFVPIPIWGVVNIVIGLYVLWRDIPIRILTQSIVVIFEGMLVAAATIGNPNVSPLAGGRLLTVGVALWILALRILIGELPSKAKKR